MNNVEKLNTIDEFILREIYDKINGLCLNFKNVEIIKI